MVSIDEAALSQAFGVKIDQNAISAKTAEYIQKISSDITTDTTPAYEALKAKFDEFTSGLASEIPDTIALSEVDGLVENYMAKQDLRSVLDQYVSMGGSFNEVYGEILTGLNAAYRGLLKGLFVYYVRIAVDPTITTDPANPVAHMNIETFNNVKNNYSDSAEVVGIFDKFATALTEISIRQKVIQKVSDLASYLSSSFANAFNVDQNAIIGAFKLNFSEEELSRVVTAMFTKKKSTLATNLSALGYQDLNDPTKMSFYFWSFDGKSHFMEFLNNYNEKMRSLGMEDKVIDYTDTTGVLMSSVKTIVDAVSYVLIAFVSISLVVSSIMIGVITYISVYERKKEIGILRAIGASKHNISSIFNAETFIIGFLSGIFGITISYLLIPIINLVLHHFTGDIPLNAALDPKTALFLIILSVILTLIGGLIPARSASKKDPVEALRSE